MGAFAPCAACGETVNVEYACPYCRAAPARATGDEAIRPEHAGGAPETAPVKWTTSMLVEPETETSAVRLIDYRSTYGGGVLLQLLLGVFLVFSAWTLATGLPYLQALRQTQDGVFGADSDEFFRIEDTYTMAWTLRWLILAFVAVVWLMWFYRSYRNLETLGRTRSYAAGWALFGWVVPIVNLFRPRQIAGELWLQSRLPDPPPSLLDWHPEPHLPRYIDAWWAAYLLGGLVTVVGPGASGGTTVDAIYDATRWEVAGVVALIMATPLAIAVVHAINVRQHLLAHALDVRT